jgi:uncharacterized protein (DUF1499 family)
MGLLSGRRPDNLGVKEGRLAPIPASPNAVSSQTADSPHRIDPLRYQTTQDRAMRTLAEIVRTTPRTRIVQQTSDYLYAEYTSALMGFVDDVEFYFPPDARQIEVRSASRLGHSDFGVNRKRIESIRAKLAASGP